MTMEQAIAEAIELATDLAYDTQYGFKTPRPFYVFDIGTEFVAVDYDVATLCKEDVQKALFVALPPYYFEDKAAA